MSQGTNVVYNPLERILSNDLNLAQTMGATWATEMERAAMMSGLESIISSGDATARNRRGIVAGFAPTTGGANELRIAAAGALWMYSASTPPIPPNDSGYSTNWRFAAQLDEAGQLTFALPVGGAFCWYLLEASIEETVITDTRDIKNTVTGLFVPTIVPVAAFNTIIFRLTAGTPGVDRIPAPTSLFGSDWVPIAAARAPAGGGVVPTSLIYDVRRLPSDVSGFGSLAAQWVRGSFDFVSDGGTGAGNRKITGSSSEPSKWRGVELFATYNNVDIVDELVSAGHALVANETLYIYGYAPYGVAPVRLDKPLQRGLFVVSPDTPTRLNNSPCWTNSGFAVQHNEHFFLWGSIAFGFAGTVNPNEAILMGILRVNAAADGFDPMAQTRGHVEMSQLSGVSTVGVDGAFAFTPNIPSIAVNARCSAAFVSAAKTGLYMNGGALAGWYQTFSLVPAGLGAVAMQDFPVVPGVSGTTFVLTSFPAGPGAYTASVWLAAFDW